MLSERECEKIERALTEDIEPRKLAAYLCLHMGLTVAEASALRLADIDLHSQMVNVNNTLTRVAQGEGGKSRFELAPLSLPRILPMPPQVFTLLEENMALYAGQDCFLVSGQPTLPGAHLLQNLLVSVNNKYKITGMLTAARLRNAFIRRCLEHGVDLYTLGEYVGVKQLSELQKRFSSYLKPRLTDIAKLNPTEPQAFPPAQSGKRMNLLILGAGSQGRVVKETAEALGVFQEIAFLDDDKQNKLAMDTCVHYKEYVERYPISFPSFGDCQLRAKWIEQLEEAGFILPALIHPMATVSPSATVEAGSIVEAKAIVGTNAKIGKGSIISSGAIVDHNVVIGPYCHIDCAATIKKDACVDSFIKIESGQIVEPRSTARV